MKINNLVKLLKSKFNFPILFHKSVISIKVSSNSEIIINLLKDSKVNLFTLGYGINSNEELEEIYRNIRYFLIDNGLEVINSDLTQVFEHYLNKVFIRSGKGVVEKSNLPGLEHFTVISPGEVGNNNTFITFSINGTHVKCNSNHSRAERLISISGKDAVSKSVSDIQGTSIFHKIGRYFGIHKAQPSVQ